MVDATPLSKIDSAVEAGDAKDQKASNKKSSSTSSNVHNINDLGMLVDHKLKPHADCKAEKEGVEIKIAPETQHLNWYEHILRHLRTFITLVC